MDATVVRSFGGLAVGDDDVQDLILDELLHSGSLFNGFQRPCSRPSRSPAGVFGSFSLGREGPFSVAPRVFQ